jgi:hypothetical protein
MSNIKKMAKSITFPLSYVETRSHGRDVIKPLPKLQGWSTLTSSVVVPESQGTGLQTGKRSGITVIDFDRDDIYESVCNRFPEFNQTLRQKTPNGMHVIFEYDEIYPTRSFNGTKLNGLDIRNDNGCIVFGDSNYQIDMETQQREYYKVLDENKRLQPLSLEFYEYISEHITETGTEPKPKAEQQGSITIPTKAKDRRGFRYSNRDIKPIEEALAQIDPIGKDWHIVSNCLKGLYEYSKIKQVKQLWNDWSRMSPNAYDERNNEKLWNKIVPKIHPNYLFKKAGMKPTVWDITYIDEPIAYDNVFSAQYVNQMIDYEAARPLPENAIERFLNVDLDKRNQRAEFTNKMRTSDIAIKAGTGTGKTTLSVDHVRHHCKNDRVVNITLRRSLAAQHKKSFNGLGFQHYQAKTNHEGWMMRPNGKIIIQINSITKIGEVKDAVVILDELSALVRYLTNGSIRKLEQVYHRFAQIIRDAKQVIAIDGDLDQTSIDFIEKIRGRPFYKVLNTYQSSSGKRATIYQNSIAFKEKLYEAIVRGEMTAVFADTKSMVLEVEEWYKLWNVQHKVYHTDSKQSPEDISDVNKAWFKYHIACSPTITTGVDYTADERTVFLLCTAKKTGQFTTINARDMGQQVSRIRRTKELICFIDSVDTAPKFNSVEEYRVDFFANIEAINETLSPLVVQMDDATIRPNPTAFCDLKMRVGYTNMHLQANQNFWIAEILESKGFELVYDEADQSSFTVGCTHPDTREILEIIKHDATPTWCLDEEIVETIESEEIDRMVALRQSYLFETIQQRLERFRLPPDPILVDDALYELFNCSKSMQSYNNFDCITRPEHDLQIQTVFEAKISWQKNHLIGRYLDRLGIIDRDLNQLTRVEMMFGDPVINESEEKLFKNLFAIKNKIVLHTSRPKFVEQFIRVIREHLKICSSIIDAKLFEISKESKQVVRNGERLRVHEVTIDQTILDLYQSMQSLKKEKVII